MLKIGIIGGSGLESVVGIEYLGEVSVHTNHGKPSAPFKHFKSEHAEYFVLSRHGVNHQYQPANINYGANVMAFKEIGVDCVLAFSSVGGINSNYKAGSLVLLDNAIDYTSNRALSLFTTTKDGVFHIDLTHPFCDDLRKSMLSTSNSLDIEIEKNGVYVCTNGPRIETAAEIKMFSIMGADVVGMTLFPEVAMFREAEICYSCVAVVANMAAGICDTKITSDEVVAEGKKAMDKVCQLILEFPKHYKNCTCGCKTALTGAKM